MALSPLFQPFSIQITKVAIALISFFVLAISLNVVRQFLFKNRKEPPVVFHWVPFFGSAIAYGMNPFEFFFKCQRKVIWEAFWFLQNLYLLITLV